MSALTQELSALAAQWITQENLFSVAGSAYQQVALANPLRWAILFSYNAIGAGQIFLSTDPGAVTNQGWMLGGNVAQVLSLSYRDYGGLVQAPWFASAAGVNQPLTVFQMLLQQ